MSFYNLIVANSAAMATVGRERGQGRHVLFCREQANSCACVLLELARSTHYDTIRRFLGKVGADHAAAVPELRKRKEGSLA